MQASHDVVRFQPLAHTPALVDEIRIYLRIRLESVIPRSPSIVDDALGFMEAFVSGPGDVIVGMASYGQASYETQYNGGMGSNGLTSARHDVFNKSLENHIFTTKINLWIARGKQLFAMLANLILLPSLLLSLEKKIANKNTLKEPKFQILPEKEA